MSEVAKKCFARLVPRFHRRLRPVRGPASDAHHCTFIPIALAYSATAPAIRP